jgi:hypothetical protein
MNHQLKLISSHGDETFASLSYIVCGLPSAAVTAALANGVSAEEGSASVTTNLVHAVERIGNEPGKIVVLRRPAQPYLGYASDTDAVIDRKAKTVSGNPIAYAAGRDDLGWYTQSKVDTAHHLSLIVPAGYIAATIEVTPGLKAILSDVAVAAKTLAPFDLSYLETAINETIELAPSFTQGSETQVTHSLAIGTAEALVMSRLRQLRWEGLALLGYRFTDNGQPITIKLPTSIEVHRQELDRLEAQLKGQSLLTAELVWLKPHVTTAIAMMRTELNDALLGEAK